MQTLHFSFGLGAFVAPLVAEPFLSNATFNETLIELEHANANAESATQRRFLASNNVKINAGLSRVKRDETGNGTNATVIKKPKTLDPPPAPPQEPAKDKEKDKDMEENETVEKETTTRATTTTQKPTTTTLKTTTKALVTQAIAVPENDTEEDTNENKVTPADKIKDLAMKAQEAMNNLSKVEFAYLTIALFNFVVSIMFLVLCCCGEKSLKAIRNEDIQPEYIVRKENKGFRVQILIMLFVFYFLYVGMEVTYGAFLMAFCVDYLQWDKTKGVLMTSVFWGSFAIGRGLAIPLAKCLNPPVMLIADLILCCLSLTGLLMGLESNETILWFCTAVLGLGLSSVFPTGITWAERYMHVTGKATAVFVVGSALGEMAMPALVGWLFEVKNPMWLVKILLACALLSVVLYIFMQNLASNMGDRYQRLPRISLHDGVELEMDPLPISDQTEVFGGSDSWPSPSTNHRSEHQKESDV